MCYYNFVIYACLDSEWGALARFCREGDRLADECGRRLALSNISKTEQCNICYDLVDHYRHRQAEVERFKRWERESRIDEEQEEQQGKKILDTIQKLDESIKELQLRKIDFMSQDDGLTGDEDALPGKKRRRLDAISRSTHELYYDQNDNDNDLAYCFEEDYDQKDALQSFDSESNLQKVLCPYYLRHPLKHQKGSCMGPGFDTITRLKEHIIRVHKRPIQCPRCWQDMKSTIERDEHLRKDPTCQTQTEPKDERVGDELLRQIKPRRFFPKASSLLERWEILFKMIFPNDETIPSPYHPNKTCTCSASSSNNSSRQLIPVKTVKQVIVQNIRSHLESDLVKLIGSVPMQVEVVEMINQCLQQSISKAVDGMQDKPLVWASHIYRNDSNQQPGEESPPQKIERQNSANVIIQASKFSQVMDGQSVTNRRDIRFTTSVIFGMDQDTTQSPEADQNPLGETNSTHNSASNEEHNTVVGYFMSPSSSLDLDDFDFMSSLLVDEFSLETFGL